MRVLYVDDHTPFRMVVKRKFLSGHEVVGAGTLAEARAILAEQTFDVALVDFEFSDGCGVDLVREINSSCPECKVIAVPANLDQKAEMLAAGAVGSIPKNEFVKLEEKLRNVLAA
jgi:two-component system response regulator PilR (NtrC family)